MGVIGANTNAVPEILLADCVLVVGEDAPSAEPAVAACFGGIVASHAYRAYVFQRRPAVTTIFSGIGTACLEPLLWELAHSGRVRRLVLVGTAGLLDGGQAELGRAYVVGQARAIGTGLDAIGLTQAMGPRWAIPADVPRVSAISTDFYYGFCPQVLEPNHPLANTSLPTLYREGRSADLVDMETAQFYALCSRLLRTQEPYVAVKSPANAAGQGEDQIRNTAEALEKALGLAKKLLVPR